MLVETVPLSSLAPNPENPRIAGDDAVAAVARSIERFGFAHPIVARADGLVVAGHTRLAAAASLGLEEVPVVRWGGTDAEAAAFAIADNRTAEFAGWDYEQLSACLAALAEEDGEDGDLRAALGWTEEQLAAILSDPRDPGENPTPRGDDPEALAGAPPGDPVGPGYREQYGVIVVCDHEGHQRAVYDELRELGYACRVVTT